MKKNNRQNEKAFYDKTKNNQNQRLPGQSQKVSKKQQTEATPEWHWKLPTYALPPIAWLASVVILQYMAMVVHNIPKNNVKVGFFFNPGSGMMMAYFLMLIIAMPILMLWLKKKLHATWFNNNAMYVSDDVQEYHNDSYIRSIDHLAQELDIAPDVGLGFDGHVSTIMGHMMISNKGIKKIPMPQYDGKVDGYVKKDDDGNIVTKMVPMFNEELADLLFSMSGVPADQRTLYNATEYDFNRKLARKEGGGKDSNGKDKRAGTYDRKAYDKLSDFINNEFYPLDTDTERPAGVYFYDKRPVNTILIAITRAGKGQTYIEPAFDLWTREKKKWNIFTTDPKGELLAKFYYSATVRGYDIIQFNLMHPNLTNIYNPLANAVQKFRQNDAVKGTSLIDSIVEMLFPDNGEIWNPAAGNMLRRAVYLLIDYYLEQEDYIRYLGHRNGTPQDIIDYNVDMNYSKLTLFNVYSLIGELAAKVSKEPEFINIDPSAPPVPEKDLLTLLFDAMSMLPTNPLRSKAITANNSIKQIASAPQTIAGIYATLLTGLSVYADDTTIALMSGSLSESFDVGGLGFPRRFGVHLDDEYVKKFRVAKELAHWTVYRDSNFTDKYEGTVFEHDEKIQSTNWIWGYFEGLFENEVTYIKLSLKTSGGTTIQDFHFRFTKGYKKFDGITYIIDPITKKKILSGGTLVEFDIATQKPKVSEFQSKQIDISSQSYRDIVKPILTSNQVYYSERPKFVFAITPPHLQVYQKHILTIIKQILDEQYSESYVVKPSRKPIVGTRLMLEEFGNIRSGENGIPSIDTATSIALGQDVQITFVLQSFQQLRALYGEDVEKILRANSSNTIFLKSNDEELVNELVRLSGTRHEFRVKSKSVSRKMGDMITISEPVINYSGENAETTALTANDLLFLAGPSPGNSITFSSGEMPIVGKLSTITPMAAGLHRHLPQPKTGPYGDATMPSTNNNDSVNFLDNMIDGEALVKERVAQAKIWNNEIRDRVFAIAEREGMSLSETDGSLSKLVMNSVYEIYDKQSGQTHTAMIEPIVYWKIAQKMMDDVMMMSDKNRPQTERLAAVSSLRESLTRCVLDKNLSELTAVYKDTYPTTSVNVGYDQIAVSKFVTIMQKKYPKPAELKLEHQDVYSQAKQNSNYSEYEVEKELLFDMMNPNHTGALESIIDDILDGELKPIDGIELDALASDDNTEHFRVEINNVWVMDYERTSNNFTVSYNNDHAAITRAVTANALLIQTIQSYIMDGNY